MPPKYVFQNRDVREESIAAKDLLAPNGKNPFIKV